MISRRETTAGKEVETKKLLQMSFHPFEATLTYLIYQRCTFKSMYFYAKDAKSTLDTNLTRKVWLVSHLARKVPGCYIIIRKGDTNVQVKPGAQGERETGEREVKMMLDTKNLEN